MTNAQHSSASNEHYTPGAISVAACKLMNGIELDPASSDTANGLIGARSIFTEADDGLHRPWQARSVFLNPPGGCSSSLTVNTSRRRGTKRSSDTSPAPASPRRLFGGTNCWPEHRAGNVEQAVFLAFSVELVGKRPELLDFPCCFTAATATDPCISGQSRIKFLNEQLEPQGQPTHCCLIVYLPRRDASEQYQIANFGRLFTAFGKCVLPVELSGNARMAA